MNREEKRKNSFEIDTYKLIFLCVAWIISIHVGAFLFVLYENLFIFPFIFITTYLITQYKVVLLSINNPSMIKEIKTFSILLFIDIILLIILL